jgi:hypothetical protein
MGERKKKCPYDLILRFLYKNCLVRYMIEKKYLYSLNIILFFGLMILVVVLEFIFICALIFPNYDNIFIEAIRSELIYTQITVLLTIFFSHILMMLFIRLARYYFEKLDKEKSGWFKREETIDL